MKCLTALFVAAALSCSCSSADHYRECPSNAACAAGCERGTPQLCSEELCAVGQVSVDTCDGGYRGHCECQDEGDGCAALECVAGTFCFAGQCLTRLPCGDEVCEPGWSCLLGRVCVQEIATNQSQPTALQLGDGQLYYANRGTVDDDGNFNGDANVNVVSLDGGDVVQLAEDGRRIHELAVGDEAVYWSSGDEAPRLMSVAKRDGQPTMVLEGVRVLDDLTFADGKLYWVDQRRGESESRLMSAVVSGTFASSALWTRSDVSSGPLISRSGVHWLERRSTLWRSALDGSAPARLAASDAPDEQVHVMAHDGERFYFGWSTGSGEGVSVYDAARGSLDHLESFRETRGEPVAIAVDDAHVYTLRNDPKQRLMFLYRTSKSLPARSEPVLLWSTGSTAESSLAVDDVAVYVTAPSFIANHGRGILRIRKRW
jgi:hypothetical protein